MTPSGRTIGWNVGDVPDTETDVVVTIRYRATVQTRLDAPGADVVVVHVRTGSCDIDDGDAGTVRLGPGDSAWWVGGAGRVVSSEADVVRFDLTSTA